MTTPIEERVVRETLGQFTVEAPHGKEVCTLSFEGLSLGQRELDIFIGLLRLALPVGLGNPVQVSGRQVLSECEMTDCSDNYKLLASTLRRLWFARFSIATPDMQVGTPWALLESFGLQKVGRNGAGAVPNAHVISYVIGRQLAELFQLNTWVDLDTQVRRQLSGPGEALARWLHGLLMTFAPEYRTDMAVLYEESGATCTPEAFVKQLAAACKLLQRHGVIARHEERRLSGLRVMNVTLRPLRRRQITFFRVPRVR